MLTVSLAPVWATQKAGPASGSVTAAPTLSGDGRQSEEGRPGSPSPQPGILQYNADWAVGCDNLFQCEAIALWPEAGGGGDEPLLLQIIRPGGPAGEALLRVSGLSQLPPEIIVSVDGNEAARLVVQGDEAILRGAAALRAVQIMGSATTIELCAAGKRKKKPGAVLSTLSSAGLMESLRFIDSRQGRTGTLSAFVSRGSASETIIPSPPAIPVVQQVPALDADIAPGLNAVEMASARRLARCDAMLMANGAPELFSLDGDAALLLLPCEAGAYNVSAVPLIVRGPPGERSLSIAHFDFSPGFTGEPGKPPLVVNALWDAHRGVLSSLAKGRGIGDCGASENYVWDGTMFRLIESRAMHVCRGAWEWIKLWEAEPRRAPLPSVAQSSAVQSQAGPP
jgi:hypothetical protein